jgi:hypothetical protein
MHESSGTEAVLFEHREGPARRSLKKRRGYRISVLMALLTLPVPALIGAYDPGTIPRWYAAFSPLIAILAFIAWHDRRIWLSTNSVRITTRGICPPFKEGTHRSASEWFVPYPQVAEMRVISEKGDQVVFEIHLRNGERFQLNPMDILEYASEREAREYTRVLRTVASSLDRSYAASDGTI